MALTLNIFHALARKAGAGATHVARTAHYGTRRHHETNASDAHSWRSASGFGVHSVFQGPKLRRNGGPIVRRPS